MRIAQVAPLYESVPPKLYGGTERVVSYLTEELAAQGHDVTLFASGDSVTKARLRAPVAQALRLGDGYDDPIPYHLVELEHVLREAHRFDVVHFHTDYIHFPLARRLPVPHVTTLHGRLDLRDLPLLYREFEDIPLVSISDAQREPLQWANWKATVYHGLPVDLYRPVLRPEGYLAFLGRISPEKRPDRAIEIARRAGVPLRIAAKVDRADRDYFETKIRPLLSGPGVEFIGEIGEKDKNEFLGNALALLFPIDWPEPFGLVMIESMACGTPIVAFRGGSVPEVIDEGVTGFIVEDIAGAVAAVERVAELDRRLVRRTFERRFTAARMARDYLAVYRSLTVEVAAPKAA
ncbi:MAG: glycosyltransferase family 4 protein [Candidatus Dadabacteria bacterium]|nr:MAG: glycosyltransferase family 4 protein [Candidatus Dadabacteria bacterium]